MPSLSPETAAQLRDKLDAARNDIVGHIRTRLEGSDEPAAVSLLAHLGQPDDMSQAAYLGDNELAQLGQEQGLLHAIDMARQRLNQGVANVCIVCGQDIPDERLLAMPTAQTCMRCQQGIENEAGVTHGPTM